MKITVLVDNNTLIKKNYYGEHGLSFYIEEGENKILFDVGYSDIFLRNAYKMGIDLKRINHIILSHGHLDHTWGLNSLMGILDYYSNKNLKNEITLLTHPQTLCLKTDDEEQIGLIYSKEVLSRCFNVVLSEKPVWLSEKLVFLGQIERTNCFENKRPLGKTIVEGVDKDDFIMDDTALAYKTDKGLIIITGCSHAGICNTVEYAKKICEDDRIIDIIGGFHLLNPSKEQMQCTLDYMEGLKPEKVHACHCTDLNSKVMLSRVIDLEEVGVGTEIEYI